MDGTGYERDDTGDTHVYHGYGQDPGPDDDAYADDGRSGANPSGSPPPGYRRASWPFGTAWGSTDQSQPDGRDHEDSPPPPRSESPFDRPSYGQSSYHEPEFSDSGFRNSAFRESTFGGPPNGQSAGGDSTYGEPSSGEFPSGESQFGGSSYGQGFGWPPPGPSSYGPPPHRSSHYGEPAFDQTDDRFGAPGRLDQGRGVFDRHADVDQSGDLGRPRDYGWSLDEDTDSFRSAAGDRFGLSDHAPGYAAPGHAAPGHAAPGHGAPGDDPASRGAIVPGSLRRLARRTAESVDEDADDGRRRSRGQGRRSMPLWQELPLLLVVAFCLAVLIRTFLLQAFYIPSSSMEDTLLVGDRVLVNKIVYDVRAPERGEVIVFRGTDSWAPENLPEADGGFLASAGRTVGDLVGLSRPGEKDFVKRVIGVPGDRVSCCDPDGRIYVNGQGIDEPYVLINSPVEVPPDPNSCRSRRFDEVLVQPGQLFVMGDHRIVSQDSRCQGTVPIENVIGRAFVIVWPSGRWDTMAVPETFAQVPGPVALGNPGTAGQPPSATVLGAAAIAVPIVASLVAMKRSGRKRRWGRRTLPR